MRRDKLTIFLLWLVKLLVLGCSYVYLVILYEIFGQNKSSYDWVITIYSYDRPRLLYYLLLDIVGQEELITGTRRRVFLQIIDDNTIGCYDAQYWRSLASENVSHFYRISSEEQLFQLPCAFPSRLLRILEILKGGRLDWQIWISKRNFGKYEHWRLVRLAFENLRSVPGVFYVFLQDDMRLCSHFFHRARRFWLFIEDTKKMTLSLHCDKRRVNYSGWTKVVSMPMDKVVRTGWVESSNFLSERSFLEWINFTFPSVKPSRWYRRRYASSGVGEILSSLLHREGYHMYRTSYSLLYHCQSHNSKMHSVIRKEQVLETHAFMDGDAAITRMELDGSTVTCSMASTWPRAQLLYDSLYSLAPQVDTIYLYLNDYLYVPQFLHVGFIQIVSSSESSDLGDVGKFYMTPHSDFHFTLDDDIIYPANFVSAMIDCYQSLPKPALLGVHGVILDDDKLFRHDYFHSRTVVNMEMAISYPCRVNIVGTGAMLYQPRIINISKEIFEEKNMADIYVAILAKSRNISLFIVNRSMNWIVEQRKDDIPSIYEALLQNGQKRRKVTKLLREHMPWNLSQNIHSSICYFT
ncbi:hypothetical protein GAYE_SCF03G2279 [Galdieria yellowstonensis]|uniref:Uncharacterized protein n=1 Tax=Galdieria yellowstonensis TaxID=3028027 RepID=A0AAV9IAD9_9RHOD|nr:hypothetical protein GAYE_SCF03G2279 [Galdieria yellowstonensis]